MNKIFCTLLVCCLAVSVFADSHSSESHSAEHHNEGAAFIKEIQNKCKTVTGNELYFLKVLQAIDRVKVCLTGVVDGEALNNHIQTSIQAGTFEGLFNETCHKRDAVFACLESEKAVFDKCLTAEEISDVAVLVRVAKRAAGALCVDDGDQITVFFVHEGHVCIEQNKETIKTCIETTFPDAKTSPNKYSTSHYVNDENCSDLHKLQQCIVPNLAHCTSTTPSTFVDSIFTAVFDELSCAAGTHNEV